MSKTITQTANRLYSCLLQHDYSYSPPSPLSAFLLTDFRTHHFYTYECFLIRTQREHFLSYSSYTPKAWYDEQTEVVADSGFARLNREINPDWHRTLLNKSCWMNPLSLKWTPLQAWYWSRQSNSHGAATSLASLDTWSVKWTKQKRDAMNLARQHHVPGTFKWNAFLKKRKQMEKIEFLLMPKSHGKTFSPSTDYQKVFDGEKIITLKNLTCFQTQLPQVRFPAFLKLKNCRRYWD